jgi:hypothetical protein
VANAKLYTEKSAITAADMLNDRVVPFFDGLEIPLMRILTDRGTEYCSPLGNHAYELFLSIEGIDHTKTKAYTPQTNGICEKFHKTMKNEFYDSALRKKIYTSLEELQTNVEIWLRHYNQERPHGEKCCCERLPSRLLTKANALPLINLINWHTIKTFPTVITYMTIRETKNACLSD